MSDEGYPIPATAIETEEVIKGSRFITRVFCTPTVEAAKSSIRERNRLEPDATHHCWAYIVGDPHSTTTIACSDDGEPNGTAGMPMLNILQHSHVGDITAIVTRYYGGTKLGKGGLARAYGGGVKQALELLETRAKIAMKTLGLVYPYDLQAKMDYLLGQYQARVLESDYQEDIHQTVEIAASDADELKAQINQQFKGSVKC